MIANSPTLYLLCGKIGAGKSTLARQLAARPATILISEDHWTSTLFADQLKTIEDYGRLSARLRAVPGGERLARLLDEVVALEAREERVALGDTLPAGLRLLPDSD